LDKRIHSLIFKIPYILKLRVYSYKIRRNLECFLKHVVKYSETIMLIAIVNKPVVGLY